MIHLFEIEPLQKKAAESKTETSPTDPDIPANMLRSFIERFNNLIKQDTPAPSAKEEVNLSEKSQRLIEYIQKRIAKTGVQFVTKDEINKNCRWINADEIQAAFEELISTGIGEVDSEGRFYFLT